MFCQNCGTQNADGVKFCNNCGAPLQAAPQETTVLSQPSVQPAQQYAPVSSEPQKPKNSKKTGLIIGGVAGAIVLIVAVVLIVVFAGKGKDDKPANAESNSNAAVSDVQNTDKQDEPSNSVPTQTSMSRDEVAIAYMKAFVNLNFAEANKYCILDSSEIIKTVADTNGKDINGLYEMLSEDLSENYGEPVNIASMQDFYSEFSRIIKTEIQNENPDALSELQKYDPEIVETEKVDLKDSVSKDYLIDDILDCDPFGLVNSNNYSQFINLDDITEAYEIEIADKNGDISDTDSFYIVKYKGEWRVVANAITAFI